MGNGTARDKANKARNLATEAFGSVSYGESRNIAEDLAKSAGKTLTWSQANKAGKIIQNRRQLDRNKTANRAEFIANRTEKLNAKKAMEAAVAGGSKPKKVAPVKKAAVKKKAK